MADTFSPQRLIILTTGDRVPLATATRWYGWLRGQLANEDLEWDVVYHLRQVALGHPLEADPERFLVREGLLTADGSLDPNLKAVILAGVRGEGRQLSVESPFTDPLDRAAAEFSLARDYLTVHLTPAERRAVFADPVLADLDALAADRQMPPAAPAPDLESFVDRVAKRVFRPNDPDSPSPPPPPPPLPK